MANGLPEDLGTETEKTKPVVDTRELSAKEKLGFAKQILFGAAVLFIAAAAIQAIWPDRGHEIFDAALKILPPIVTLIIGSYFTSSARS